MYRLRKKSGSIGTLGRLAIFECYKNPLRSDSIQCTTDSIQSGYAFG